MNLTKDLKEVIASTITSTMVQMNIYKSSPEYKDSPTHQDPTTAFQANMRAPPLEGGHSTKIGGMWTLKHEISSPKFYEILIKTELKNNTPWTSRNSTTISICVSMRSLDSKKTFIPDYQSIKIYSDFEEYFIPDLDHPSYSWNFQIYNFL